MRLSKMHNRVASMKKQRGFFMMPGGRSSGIAYPITNSLRLRPNAYLSRTFGTPTDNKKWKFSIKAKRGKLGSQQTLIGVYSSATDYCQVYFDSSDRLVFSGDRLGANAFGLTTTAQWRDVTGHYDIEVVFDSNNATPADRGQIWVDGVRQAVTGTAVPSGASNFLNNATSSVTIGNTPSFSNYFDGLVSEIYFVDGQGYVSGSFGQADPTNPNNWVPKKYAGTFGNNGFYLDFKDGSNLTNLGLDRSGNGNNWTLNGVSLTAGQSYDWLTDTLTKNFNCINALDYNSSYLTLSSGNLRQTYAGVAAAAASRGTIAIPTTGKWVVGEIYLNTQANSTATRVGICRQSDAISGNTIDNSATTYALITNGNKRNNSTDSTYGANITTAAHYILVLYDADTGSLYFAVDGQYANGSGSWNQPWATATAAFTGLSGTFHPFLITYAGNDVSWNSGQQPFNTAIPSGFKTLCTENLTAVTIKDPSQHHYVKTLAKSGDTSFTLPWDATLYDTYFEIKRRDAAGSWYNVDGLRGYDKILHTDTGAAETTDANVIGVSGTTVTLKSSLTDGSYDVKCWKAGLVSGRQTNTNGSITSTVSVNPISGFSILTYSGSGSAATIGHGLPTVPRYGVVKNRSAGSTDWCVWHSSVASTYGNAYCVFLELTAAAGSYANVFNSTAPTSSVFSVGSSSGTNTSGNNYVAYFHSEVAGYSKFGSYLSNASADGPNPWLGFKARNVTIKDITAAAGSWFNLDTSRDASNVAKSTLTLNSNGSEDTSTQIFDIDAGSIKLRTDGSSRNVNTSGSTNIFMAWAEAAFGGSNISPACAR